MLLHYNREALNPVALVFLMLDREACPAFFDGQPYRTTQDQVGTELPLQPWNPLGDIEIERLFGVRCEMQLRTEAGAAGPWCRSSPSLAWGRYRFRRAGLG